MDDYNEMVFYIPYKDLSSIPLSEYKNLFKEYWATIYEFELDHKPQIMCTDGEVYIRGTCFACHYSEMVYVKCMRMRNHIRLPKKQMEMLNQINICTYCPLYGHPDNHQLGKCTNKGTPYDLWAEDANPKYALAICKLNWSD